MTFQSRQSVYGDDLNPFGSNWLWPRQLSECSQLVVRGNYVAGGLC